MARGGLFAHQPDVIARPATLTKTGITLAVRVTTRAGQDALGGCWHDADGRAWLSARVAAAPTDGNANTAIISMLCIQFSLRKAQVILASGAASRLKRFELIGDPATLAAVAEKCGGEKP